MKNGGKWLRSGWDGPKGIPHIYAPGDRLLGPQGDKAQWQNNDPATYKDASGTSVCKFVEIYI